MRNTPSRSQGKNLPRNEAPGSKPVLEEEALPVLEDASNPNPKETILSKILTVVRSEQFRKISALALMASGVFIFFALVSHFFYGSVDADLAENGLSGGGIKKASNWLGALGAWIAYRFISDGLGFIALTIPVLMVFTGYGLLEKPWMRLASLLFYACLFLWPWTAMTGAWVAQIFSLESPDWGGAIGLRIVESLDTFIGKAGTGLLILISLLSALVVKYNIDLKPNTWLQKTEQEDEVVSDEEDSSIEGEKKSERKKRGREKSETAETLPLTKEEESEMSGTEAFGEEEEEEQVEFEVEENVGETTEEGELNSDREIAFTVTPATKDSKTSKPAEVAFTFEKPAEEPIMEGGLLDGHENVVVTEGDKVEKVISEEDQDKSHEMDTVVDWSLYDPTLELRNYKYPTIDLLNHQPQGHSPELEKQELVANKEKIETTLRNYGIEIVSIKATIGPTVTLYEIVPAPGIKISKIRNLEDDIALSLAALGIRIIAPIPGKGTIGIEIPNSHPEMVTFRSVIGTEKFRDTKAELPIAIGKTITNEVYIADLTKMPHLLIAGATGQGKSVGLNNIIASILYKKHPSQIKFVLIDPKKVEMPLYQPIEQHFLAKLPNYEDAIITDSKQVIHVLNSLCMEMDSRYDLLKMAHTRNITEYNRKFMDRKLNPLRGHKFLPYIVLVIDELADLMMTAGKEVETPIARLAQLARAVGIHLVVATQRPSVNVITGIIKANFPTRVSYKVSSKIDSRTILDQGGADRLIGRGDMLLSNGSDLIRIQNAFIDTPEVEKLVAFISEQTGYPEPYYLPEVMDESDADEEDDFEPGEKDRMFDDAARLIVRHQQGSTSLIQRRLKLGYNRAGRIMDQLERSGIVGPTNGSKPRDVLVHTEADLEQFLNRNA
jgi:S-DNA-T family DNA segregation ATPase FtsK/SpoIIIE